MSHTAQIKFSRLIETYYNSRKSALNLASPRFKYEGFISHAMMAGAGGSVEIRCGPAEYHAELFINSPGDNRRWTLADLVGIERVRQWLIRNRPSTVGRSRLEAEIDGAFSLLADGLQGVADFQWLHRSAS